MSFAFVVVLSLGALMAGGLFGWLIGGRAAGAMKVERDLHLENFRAAIRDLEAAIADRDSAKLELVNLRAAPFAVDTLLAEWRDARNALAAQLAEVGNRMLCKAQKQFLDRAEQRFRKSEENSGQALKSLLQPVNERLQR